MMGFLAGESTGWADEWVFDLASPTTTLYLALGLSALSMRKVGTVIALLQPGD